MKYTPYGIKSNVFFLASIHNFHYASIALFSFKKTKNVCLHYLNDGSSTLDTAAKEAKFTNSYKASVHSSEAVPAPLSRGRARR